MSAEHDPALVERMMREIGDGRHPSLRARACGAIDAVLAWQREHAEPIEITGEMVRRACIAWFGARRESVDSEEMAMRSALEAAILALRDAMKGKRK